MTVEDYDKILNKGWRAVNRNCSSGSALIRASCPSQIRPI